MTKTDAVRTSTSRPTWRQVAEELSLDPTNPALVWDAVLHQLSEHLWDGPNIVYLMHSCYRVKIGRTDQGIERRTKAISRAVGRSVTVMAYIHASPELERSLHAIFWPWCCVGDRHTLPGPMRDPADPSRDPGPWTKEWFHHTTLLSRLARVMNAIQPHDPNPWTPTDGDRQEAGFVQRMRQ